MKKSIFAYILGLSVLLVLTAGCGNSESTGKQGGIYGECYPDETCNEGLVCDTDHNTCIKEKGDAEMPAADEDADHRTCAPRSLPCSPSGRTLR